MTLTDEGLRVVQFPGAVNVITLRSGEAAELVNLTRHRVDLDFAASCLAMVGAEAAHSERRDALWLASLVSYFKCFTRNHNVATVGRAHLHADAVLGTSGPHRAVFDTLKIVRDKHLAHDEGTHMFGHVGAAISADGHVMTLLPLVGSAGTAEGDNPSNFAGLLGVTRTWVEHRWSTYHAATLKKLHALPAEKLLNTNSLDLATLGL